MTIINQIISYKLSGISYSGTAPQLNYTAEVTEGICRASKALVVNASKDIIGINNVTVAKLTASIIEGVISSNNASQPNITALGTLTGLLSNGNVNILQHDGNTTGLTLAGTLLVVTGVQLNYNRVTTAGVAQPSRTLVLDSSSNITGINILTSSTLKTDSIFLGGTELVVNGNQINYNNITTPGIAQASKTVVLNSSNNISNINILSANTITAATLTGTLSTASQPNITSVGTLTSLTLNGSISGVTNLSLTGTLTGASSISATNITGVLQTQSQPNITTVGNLSNLTVAGGIVSNSLSVTNITVGGNDITTALTNVSSLNGSTVGQAVASKVLIVDASRNIANINSLTATSIIATNITGSLQTSSQPNITAVGALTSLAFAANGSITNLTNIAMTGVITGASTISATSLSGLLTSPNQTNITSLGRLSNLLVNGSIGIATTIPSRQLEINSTTGSCLRLSYNAPTGSATNYSDFTIDGSNNLIINTNGGNINLIPDIVIGDSTSPNQISFAQLGANNGDTFITERIYTGALSELLLFNGNRLASSGGADRIRMRSGEIRFQIYQSAETYSSFNDNNNALIINSTGKISINSIAPTQQLEINNASGNCLRLINNNSLGTATVFTDVNINNLGNLNIKSTGNFVQIGDATDTPQRLLIGTSLSGGITGALALLTTSSNINYLQSGVGNVNGSSQDFAIVDYGMTAENSNRKIMFKSSGLVGIGTYVPSSKLEISDLDGNCLKLSFNAPAGNATQYCYQSISSSGLMSFNVIGTSPSFAFTTANNQIANVAAIIETPTQPNIRTLGTLTGLNISGNINSVTNIVMAGTLTGATSIGSSSTVLVGLINNPNQTNITGLGILNNLAVKNFIQVGTTNNSSATDLLYASGNTNGFIGLRLENLNPTANSSGSIISFTGFNNTNGNWELARIACLTTNSGSAASYQFGSMAFYVRNTQLSANATEVMRLSNSGFLGINTNNPGYHLTVNGTTSTNTLLVRNSTDTRSIMLISALDSTLTNSTARFFAIGKSVTTNNQFEIGYNHIADGGSNFTSLGMYGSAFRMFITATGVGIGTSTPNRVFEINQNGAVYGLRLTNNANSLLTDIGTDGSGNLIINNSNNSVYIGTTNDTSQSLSLGTSSSTGTSGILNMFTTASGNFIQSSINTTTGSSQDLYICDYIPFTQGTMPNILLSNRKIVIKASGAVGLGNIAPSRQLEINHPTGSCLRLSNGSSSTTATTNNFCDQTVSSTGFVTFNAVGSGAGFQFLTSGNTTATVVATLQTAAQPNITSVGALTNLAFANNGSITNLSNLAMTGVITGVTTIGTALNPVNYHGTLQTAAQPNITSIGTLSNLTLNGQIVGGVTGITFGTNVSLTLPSSGVGVSSLSAGYLYGQVQTASQPNITSVGSLNGLSFQSGAGITNVSSISFSSGNPSLVLGGTGSISAGSIAGTISTASQPNITSVGRLTGLYVGDASFTTSITLNSNITTMSFAQNSIINMTGNSFINANSLTLGISVNTISANDWGLNGIQFNSKGITYQNNSTAINTTVSNAIFNSFAAPTLTASSTGVTTTTAATVWIGGAPNAGTNQTITNRYALLVESGATKINQLLVGTSTDTSSSRLLSALNSNMTTGSSTFICLGQANTSLNQAELSFTYAGSGSTSNKFNFGFFGTTLMSLGADNTVSINGAANITGSVSINNPNLASNGINTITFGKNGNPRNQAIFEFKYIGDNDNNNLLSLKFPTNVIKTLSIIPGCLGIGIDDSVNGGVPRYPLDFGSTARDKIINLFAGTYTIGANDSHIKYQSGGGHAWYCNENTGNILMQLLSNGQLLLPQRQLSNGVAPLRIMAWSSSGQSSSSGAYTYYNNGVSGPGSANWNNYSIHCNDVVVASGFIAFSDRRMKTNIEELDIDFCKSFITECTPVSYNLKEDLQRGRNNMQFGYIAQELEKKGFASIVTHMNDPDNKELIEIVEDGVIDENGNKYISPQGVKLSVSYTEIIPILAKNIKNIYNDNDNISDRVSELEDENKLLKEQLDNMQKSINLLLQRLN